jgi:hypothetical protein
MTGASVLPERFEVRPRLLLKMTLVMLGCAAFTLASAWLVSRGTSRAVFAGLLGIVVFGFGGLGCLLYFMPKVVRRKISMVLTRAGIEFRYVPGNTFLPWEDIETIGVFALASGSTSSFVGVRLRAYENYIRNLTPELVRPSLTILKVMSLGKVRSISGGLEWSRKKFGYDITIGWADRDRPPEKFAALLEEYRAAA